MTQKNSSDKNICHTGEQIARYIRLPKSNHCRNDDASLSASLFSLLRYGRKRAQMFDVVLAAFVFLIGLVLVVAHLDSLRDHEEYREQHAE